VEITASAISLNVEDVPASRAFLVQHFDFLEEMAADGFALLTRSDAGMNVVFLRRGLESLPGVAITMPSRAEEWGQRAFQVRDHNGVIIELVDWNGAVGA
jgi:hypothetical protein